MFNVGWCICVFICLMWVVYLYISIVLYCIHSFIQIKTHSILGYGLPMRVRVVCACTRVHASTCACVCMYVRVHVCACMFVCASACKSMPMHACTHMHTCAHLYICMCVSTDVHTCVHACVCQSRFGIYYLLWKCHSKLIQSC